MNQWSEVREQFFGKAAIWIQVFDLTRRIDILFFITEAALSEDEWSEGEVAEMTADWLVKRQG
ncbi:MAG: hypothetical protein ACUVQH_00230 [Thermogutta sp.]